MRRPAPDARPVALTIAGSDSGGGAGIQADLATMAAHGAYGTSVVTAVTAQHTRGVERSTPLPAEDVAAQLSAVRDDFAIGAAKTGMLATTETVEAVADRAADFDFPLVVDPVMVATSGDRLLEPAAERAYEDLIAEARLVTPNADEAEVLTGIAVEGESSAREAADRLLGMGADAALVKGGHVPGETVRDVLVTGTDVVPFEHPRVETGATHGSGCALAAAIAARLAAGDGVHVAVDRATDFLARAVRYHYDVGEGPGAVNHLAGLRNEAARESTAGTVRDVADRLGGAELSALVQDGDGTDRTVTILGATPYAESIDEIAVATPGAGADPAADGSVRFGAPAAVADALLAARERFPEVRFAANVGGDGIERALPDRPVVEYEGGVDPETFANCEIAPPAVIDRDGDCNGPVATLFAADGDALVDRVLAARDRIADDD